MKSISVKFPTIKGLAKAFPRGVEIFNEKGDAFVSFGLDSTVSLKNLGKTVSLTLSPKHDWQWVGVTIHTRLDVDDLRTLFPRRKFKEPLCHTKIGCTSLSIEANLDISLGSHTCTEEQIENIEELLAARREMKK